MRGLGRLTRWSAAMAVTGALVLNSTAAFAALDKCEKRIDGEAKKLQGFMFTALQLCKDAVQKENTKGIVTGRGTNCAPGGGCFPTAAALCEKQLEKVYDVTNLLPVGTSKVAKFRAALVKSRTPNGAGVRECEDADLNIFSGLGHLMSGSDPGFPNAAPPTVGDAGKFMIDWYLFAIEKVVIKEQIFLVPEMLTLLQDAVETGAGPTNPAGIASKKATVCGPTLADLNTQAYRPNLCRFGVECRDHACNIDASGICSGGAHPACTINGPACPSGNCVPSNSYAQLESAALDFSAGLGQQKLGFSGRLVTEICRPGRSTGACKNAAPCTSDTDCASGQTPCNLFPGQGAGAAFGVEPNFLYLINEPSKTLQVPIHPITVPAFSGLVYAACLEIERSEGWCDCAGTGIKNNVTTCRDHITSNNVTNDDCGSPISAGNGDSLYPGTVNGALSISTSGASVAGDCIDLLTVQAKLLITSGDAGVDTLPCTDDDLVAPIAPITVPGTTGTANATIKDAVDTPGSCSGGPNPGNACIEDVNCGTCVGGTNIGNPCTVTLNCPGSTCFSGTCGGQQIHAGDFTQGPVAGSKTNCSNYQASNLSGLTFVGAAPVMDVQTIGDATIEVRISCQ